MTLFQTISELLRHEWRDLLFFAGLFLIVLYV